jgi:hypothetical protein
MGKIEGYTRESKYGSRIIADTNEHVIDAHVIEIITAATFTILKEEGNPISGTTASVAQVDTVTLAGTAGQGVIRGPGGLSKNVIFNTSLTQTAADFVTDHAAAYAAVGITVTSLTANIIFTSAVAGEAFQSPRFNYQHGYPGDLSATVAHTTANLVAPLNKHSANTAAVGAKIYADTKFIAVALSAGSIAVY